MKLLCKKCKNREYLEVQMCSVVYMECTIRRINNVQGIQVLRCANYKPGNNNKNCKNKTAK